MAIPEGLKTVFLERALQRCRWVGNVRHRVGATRILCGDWGHDDVSLGLFYAHNDTTPQVMQWLWLWRGFTDSKKVLTIFEEPRWLIVR